MKLPELHSKIIVAARALPPGDQVPYAFEKRIMAHLAALPKPDSWSLWGYALWRAAAPCVAIVLLLGGWTFYAENQGGGSRPLAHELEEVVLAGAENLGEN
jgi:hypothetical protein